MDNQEELDEGKIVYDWNPPSGKLQNFFYKGAAIDRDHVSSFFSLYCISDTFFLIMSFQVNKMFDSSKIRECKGHKEKVHTVAWNCDGRKLASGSVDKTARVWSPHRGVSKTTHAQN